MNFLQLWDRMKNLRPRRASSVSMVGVPPPPSGLELLPEAVEVVDPALLNLDEEMRWPFAKVLKKGNPVLIRRFGSKKSNVHAS